MDDLSFVVFLPMDDAIAELSDFYEGHMQEEFVHQSFPVDSFCGNFSFFHGFSSVIDRDEIVFSS